LLAVLASLAACGSMTNDLFPSGEDKRPPVEADATGPEVGQKAPDFSVPDTGGATVTLASALASKKAIVMYFTMWCPICDSHMSHMLNTIVPLFPDVGFYAVDYVSGTVDDAGEAETVNGYAGTDISVLADIDHSLLQSYLATMGTTVVIDSAGIVLMNEDYRNGARLQGVLAGLP
jgi:peroxiredoxin